MNCRRCGKKLGDSLKCSFCGYENIEGNVREMTRTENNFFDGVTINADGTEDTGRERTRNFRHGYINLGETGILMRLFGKFLTALMSGNGLAKIAVTLIFLAFAALMFFIAVPLVFFMIAVGVAFWLYAKFIKTNN